MKNQLVQLDPTLVSLTLLLLISSALIFTKRRKAKDVLADLEEASSVSMPTEFKKKKDSAIQTLTENKKLEEFNFLHTLTIVERETLKKSLQLRLLLCSVFGLLIGFLIFHKISLVLLAGFSGVCLGYLFGQRRLANLEDQFRREIVFFLPVVMERIVMAVQAGLDILPALKTLDDIEKLTSDNRGSNLVSEGDVVTKLLAQVVRLCESGMSFEHSLREVANSVKSNSLRHCFIHLGVAQKEGGELLYPLRELSDATQLYYQESVEEEIARMPIKATVPLLMTFAGLILSFMTGPVVQILNISTNPQLVAKGGAIKMESLEKSGVQKN